MEDLIGRQLGDYQIIEQIGKGGMASVYRAFQPSLERDVAIKVLPPYYAQQDESFTQRFKREAKAIANLRHPNILMVMEAGEQDDLAYIVMEYIQAGTLKERMKHPISLKEIYNLVRQIASALEHAHEKGIVHRDIKPSNIMLPKHDWALLTDFGLAHMVGGSLLTQSGMTVGTPAYMSPEQGRGERVDHRTDIYSLGIMLYEMTVGEVPYTAETPMAVVVKHIVDPLPIPRDRNPNIPEELQRIILKALAKNPDDRYQSAGEFAAALERVASSHPDWSVSEMKAVNAVRQPQIDHPETVQLDDKEIEDNLAEDFTLHPPADRDLITAPPPVPITASQSAPSGHSQPVKTKEKRRWPLIIGGVLLSVFCVFLSLAALSSILENRGGAETNQTDDMLYANEQSAPEEFALAAEPEDEAAFELEPAEADQIFTDFDRIGELVQQGDLEQAQEIFRNISERFPRAWEIIIARRVQPLVEQGDFEQAIRLLEAGLAVNPEAPPEAYENAGFLNWELGRPEEALHTFEQAAIHHPEYVPAYRDIQYVSTENEGQLIPEGIAVLENLMNANPEEAAARHALGTLYFFDGQVDQSNAAFHEARELYARILDNKETNPMRGWNSLGLATVLFYLEEELDSLESLFADVERLGFRDKDKRLLEELAWLYVEMDDCSRVTRLFGEIKDQFPGYQMPVELREVCP